MPGGVCTPDELRRIADVAVKYEVPLVKVTGGQRIDLVGVPKDQLPRVWQELGMPAGSAWGKSYRTCKSCIGIDYCRFGLGDSMGLALKIERRFRGIDSPGKAQARHRRLSAQLLRGADQGRRRGRDRRWQVGNLHRRRRRLARAQGRPAVRRRQRRRCAALFRPLHAVLSRERQVQGADLHLRRTARHRAHSRRRDWR